ncbi:hypothetical protein LTR36_005099 [Oleoguttula mirabilis]|uniref:Uncharacterized protein n=1 Tax=Oleoguttula mirabilis TaxID=1507867 RepID=A0AAV9JXK4_9PEZI|nr:hypothetical protein LTR36_005099 [Oleoguttula mirabilis]
MESALRLLPAELRNRIHELVLIQEPLSIDDTMTATQPPITYVCRSLREETTSIFYGSNQFNIDIWNEDISAAANWLIAIGSKNAHHIRKLEAWPQSSVSWASAETPLHGYAFPRINSPAVSRATQR